MYKSTKSLFTASRRYKVDDRRYFSDTNIDNMNVLYQYENLLKSGDYDGASKLANSSDCANYGAWVFEMFVTRLRLIRAYLQVITDDKPELTKYQTAEPKNVDECTTWISGG